ncbi:FURIN (predicted) [Pycnogonum litorale]
MNTDIYSASWGPKDDGKTVEGPDELTTEAFIDGISKGRNGLGSIFVWASGNGGRNEDNCNCDGYTNSIWTISISAASKNGRVPWYGEACSSSLTATYSSGSSDERKLITTELHHGCTNKFHGTSASAPIAAGICALVLQANRNLTWRDKQHIVVRTARSINLDAKDWAVNGVGRNVSHWFGYGLMDAAAMVKLAKTWKTVPQAKVCNVSAHHVDKMIPGKSHVEFKLEVNSCEHINYLEHVQAKITLTSGSRGDTRIYLISPRGTRSTLLTSRGSDYSGAGFTDWPFMTVHNLGRESQRKMEIGNS